MSTTYRTLETLLKAVRDCRACEAHLPLGPRPVLRASATARILVVGQAPGVRVHTTGTAPSPRNQPWFKRHPWFEAQLVPMLQPRIKTILAR